MIKFSEGGFRQLSKYLRNYDIMRPFGKWQGEKKNEREEEN